MGCVSQYTNPKLNPDQMFEIEMGLISRIDISVYKDPEIPSEEMRKNP